MAYLLILGGGESGVGAALLAKKEGIACRLSDNGQIKDKFRAELELHGIPYEEGGHSSEWLAEASEVIKSPGIPEKLPLIQDFIQRGISVISEIEFAARYLPQGTKVIGITGSNGKTTSVTWLTHTLTTAGLDAAMCGNVGRSFARLVAEEPHSYYVVELSSFQLDGTYQFHPDIAIVLNITPDHLDRYEYKFELYAESKMRITRNLSAEDQFIYWAEDSFISSFLQQNRANTFEQMPFSLTENGSAYYDKKEQVLHFKATEQLPPFSIAQKDLALMGKHNVLNAMAVALAARSLGVNNEALFEALHHYTNVPHRIEIVADIDGVRYINDSKATNIQSTYYALEAQTRPVVLILGGTDKGNDYNEIAPLVLRSCKALIFLCVDNEKLHRTFDGKIDTIRDASSMDECLQCAMEIAKEGDVVLLSPACASFDLFMNYEDRGDQFREKVLAITSNKNHSKE